MVGAGWAWVWPMLAVVAGAVSAGFGGVAATCWVDGWGAGFAASVAVFAGSAAGFTAASLVGSGAGFAAAAAAGLATATSAGFAVSAGFAASGLGLGTGTLRLATCGADGGGLMAVRRPGAGGGGPGGP